jgi:hypothetical protein
MRGHQSPCHWTALIPFHPFHKLHERWIITPILCMRKLGLRAVVDSRALFMMEGN